MRRLVFANLSTRAPSDSSAGDGAFFPTLYAGQQYPLSVRWLESVNGTLGVIDPDVAAMRASIGLVDARAESGTWGLQVGSGASTAANTATGLDWQAPAATLATALNGLSGGTADYQVNSDAGSYVITRAAGGTVTLTVRNNRLKPTCIGRIRSFQRDGAWHYDLRFIQAPLAFTDSSEVILPASPTIATIRDGGTDPSGVTFWNEIQSLTIPTDFRGTYQLRRGYARTGLLSVEDGAAEIEAALNEVVASEAGVVRVTNPSTGVAHIEFLGELKGINVDPLEVTVYSAPPGDLSFTLDLNTSEVWEALRDEEQVIVPFEFEADIYKDPADHGAGTDTIKVWSVDVTIARPVAWEGLAAAQNVDWLRPPSPTDYIPFSLTQVLTGQQQAFSAVIGNGALTSFSLSHNLASELCQVVVRENSTPGLVLRDSEYTVTITSTNALTVSGFAATPTSNQYAVFVVAVGPASVFQAHTHPVPQVVAGSGYPSLPDFMDDIGGRVATLELILPSTGPGATASQPSGIEIELPETKEILFYKGPDAFGENGANVTKLGRAPYMLPAVHDATVSNYTTGSLPAVAADSVWSNGTAAALDLGRGIYGGKVAVGRHFASDGRVRFAASREGSTTSFFPGGFERELWRIFINDKMLRLNRTLDVQFGLALQILLGTSNAQWLLVIETGTAPQQSTPSTTGTNLENIEWAATPCLSQRLIVTGNRQTHSFGARIKRSLVSSVDTITMDTLLYGLWTGADAAAPVSANFALRARLIQFDTENALATDARGWLAYETIGPEKSGKPTAVIV